MNTKSNFNHDLNQEQILGRHLDKVYASQKRPGTLTRVSSPDYQNSGVDLIYSDENKNGRFSYYIDEKAQLTYLNKSLPTFAFELSYILGNEQKKGWLFDSRKITYYYFLITSIYLKQGVSKLTHEDDIAECTLTKVHRGNLQKMLSNTKVTNPNSDDLLKQFEGIELTALVCEQISDKLRASEQGSSTTKTLQLNEYMKMLYTGFLAEKPINIVINLNYILKNTEKCSQVRYKTTNTGGIIIG